MPTQLLRFFIFPEKIAFPVSRKNCLSPLDKYVYVCNNYSVINYSVIMRIKEELWH